MCVYVALVMLAGTTGAAAEALQSRVHRTCCCVLYCCVPLRLLLPTSRPVPLSQSIASLCPHAHNLRASMSRCAPWLIHVAVQEHENAVNALRAAIASSKSKLLQDKDKRRQLEGMLSSATPAGANRRQSTLFSHPLFVDLSLSLSLSLCRSLSIAFSLSLSLSLSLSHSIALAISLLSQSFLSTSRQTPLALPC